MWNDFNKYERGIFKLSNDISHSFRVKWRSTSPAESVVSPKKTNKPISAEWYATIMDI